MEPLMDDLRESDVSPDTRFYMSWGTRESKGDRAPLRGDRSSPTYHNHKAVKEVLRGYKTAVKQRCQIGGGHCEADWEKLVPGFMEYLWCE